MLRVRLCGGLEVEADGRSLPDALVGGRQGRLVLAYLLCARPRAVHREELAELLWGDRLPDSWSASLSAVISRLRRLLTEAGLDGAEAIVSTAGTYQLLLPPEAVIDLDELRAAVESAEKTAAIADVDRALAAAATAESIAAGGFLKDDCEWVDRQREVVRDLRVRAMLARSVVHLGAGAAARAVDAARDALALDESREASYRQLMRALAAAGERGEALRVWERCRTTLVEELGVDPSPETESVYVEILGVGSAPTPGSVTTALPSGVVTFLLTDIVDSSTLWDKEPDAMALALERHDALIAEVVTRHGGTLLKSKLEGDATVSVFARASDGAATALALRAAFGNEPWPEGAEPKVRMAMHTGEAFERGGDYFGPALNRAARLRSLAGAGEVLLSQAVTELVRDHLPDHVALRDLGHRDLRGLSRGENVYALAPAAEGGTTSPDTPAAEGGALVPPPLPATLSSDAPFVGRGDELTDLVSLWDRAGDGTLAAAFIGGEPGVGKSRLAGEIAAHAHAAGGLVLYGRCDEDLGAPLQPFIEALRSLVPALGPTRVGAVRGVDELIRVVPELGELLPDRAPAVRADPDTERLALFDAVTNLLAATSSEAPVLLVLDDLHWAGKTTLSLLRHVLRSARSARLLVVGTYRDTELARTHPLAETLADLRRDADATRISLGGLATAEIEAYLAAIGIDDRALGRELAEVTSGNPFFLIEVLRHVEETGGTWSPGNLPEGVREATGRRLSRLSDAANRALSVAAVVGPSFDLALVEQAQGCDLVDEIAEACQAGLVAEEPGAIDRFRFAHALVRQVLLSELVTVKRVRLHRTIAELLEAAPVGADPDARLADLAYHWSECASLGDAGKAVDACRRAADRAMERLAYEEAGDLYGMALQVLDDADDPDGEVRAGLHLSRCDALLTAGDVASAREAIDALEGAAGGSERLAAWYTTYEGLLAVLAEPDRLTEIVQSIGAAAGAMRAIGDLRGEARAHYVHASALERLGQIGAAERALDAALAAARSADDRRLADSILAEAPPAALWGPSSVTRASGRCLDVVRVLRINDGAPAVESVALRCQAVLEALRGRPDAARKMIASARRTVERLGLAHRQLETEVAAGFVELLDGDAAEAERLLRIAYEGLRQRGLGGEAAQAGAFLGRALLLQGRVDEADEVAADAESLAGSDLKAAIAWRGVRAECAARRGDADHALRLAHEAVDLAAATDALLLVVDARLALATVLHVTGDERGAEAEAGRALEACEAKGATALAERARGGAAVRPHDPASPGPAATISSSIILTNEAVRATIAFEDRFNRGVAADEGPAHRHPDFRWEDRRHLLLDQVMQIEERADEINAKNIELAYRSGARFGAPKVLVTRGERLALLRSELRGAGVEFPYLVVVRVADNGQLLDYVMFDVDDRNAANVELDRLTPAELEVDNRAWQAVRRQAAAINAKDWDATLATFASGSRVDRRTPAPAEPIGDPAESLRVLFALDDWAREDSVIELHGEQRVLVHDVVWFRDREVAEAEVANIIVYEVDEAGLVVNETAFAPHDLEEARAELHRGTEAVPDTSATRAVRRLADALNAHDWEAVVGQLASDVAFSDRRHTVTAPSSTQLIDTYEVLFTMDDWAIERRVVETHGDRRVLVDDVMWFRSRDVAEGEIRCFNVFEVDADQRVVQSVSFAEEDLEGARAELFREHDINDTIAWRAIQRFEAAVNAGDVEALRASFAPGALQEGRRSWISPEGPEDAVQANLVIFELDEWHIEHTPLEAHGDRILVHRTTRFRDGATGDAEIATLAVIEVDREGRITRQIGFDEDAHEAARAELVASSGGASARTAWQAVERLEAAFNAQDMERVRATLHPDFTYHDRRATLVVDLHGEDATQIFRLGVALDEFGMKNRLVEARGDHLVLVEQTARFQDGAAGPAEVMSMTVIEVDDEGRMLSHVVFDAYAVDEAMAELDARMTRYQGNAAWRAAEVWADACNAKSWEGVLACMRDDFRFHDRRFAMRTDLQGADALSMYRVAIGLDELRQVNRLVAARGEALALVEVVTSFRDGITGPGEVAALCVIEVDDEGLIASMVSFEVTALEEALAELDGRATAQPRANRAWAVSERFVAAYNARDEANLFEMHSPRYGYHDRRSTLTTIDLYGDQALAQYRTALALDEFRLERRLVDARGQHLVLVREHVDFRDGATGPASIECLTVFEIDDHGLVLGNTSFEEDELDAALAALDARWQATRGAGATGNAAWEAVLALDAASDAADWDAFRAVLHPEFQAIDRRSVVSSGPLSTETYEVLFSLDEWEMRHVSLETRGDRLVLVRTSVIMCDGEAGPAEIRVLTVFEVAADGRIIRETGFDADDVDGATAALDARWEELQEAQHLLEDPLAVPRTRAVRAVEREGWTLVAAIGEHTCLHETQDGGTVVHEVDDAGQVVAALTFTADRRRAAFDELVVRGYRAAGLPDSARDITRAVLAGDHEAVVTLLSEKCTVEDHRRLHPSAPQGGSGYVAALLHQGAELATNHEMEIIRVEVPEPASGSHLAVIRMSGTTLDDAAFESLYVVVSSCNADGLMTDLAMYEPEDIDDARARLAARSRARLAGDSDPLAIPWNLAVRSVAKPGWTRLSALGEHLSLHHTGERLVLHEVDDAGEVTAFLAFSPTDRTRAFDEVASRAFTRYGAPPLVGGMLPAMNARDVAAFRACLSDDCVVEDHRNLRVLPLATGDDYAESFVLYMELAATYCVEMIRIDAMEPWGVVTLNKFTGTSNDGAAFEIPCLACSTWDASGRANLLALYEAQDVAAALERLAAAAPAVADQVE